MWLYYLGKCLANLLMRKVYCAICFDFEKTIVNMRQLVLSLLSRLLIVFFLSANNANENNKHATDGCVAKLKDRSQLDS